MARKLADELRSARSASEILAGVALATWVDAHPGAESCPPHHVPGEVDLLRWLPVCSEEAAREAGERLAAVERRPCEAAWRAFRWPDALHGMLGSPGFPAALVRFTETGLLPGPDGTTSVLGGAPYTVRRVEHVHAIWAGLPNGSRPPHPLAPIVAAWQTRPDTFAAATVTATGNGTGMTRRYQIDSTVRRTPWTLDAAVHSVTVDGEPMAARLPDPAGLFPAVKHHPPRLLKPRQQAALPVVGQVPHDLRLLAIQDISADPCRRPALPSDVLALLTLAHVADRPLTLTEREGASLLARDRTGGFRPVQPQHDIPRFWEAAYVLRTLAVSDPDGSGRWANLAHVDVPQTGPVDRVAIGPPTWARPTDGLRWTLTAEGSAASAARAAAGTQGLAGRIITGIEYRLAAGYTGRHRIAPDLQPETPGRGGPGRAVGLDWRTVLRLAGDWWEATDPKADEAARKRFDRAVSTLQRRGYFLSGRSLAGEAGAGDSIEIIGRVRASRSRAAGLTVRASARFVEAARLAQLKGGKGFEYRPLTEWAGLHLPHDPPTTAVRQSDNSRPPIR